MIDFTYGKKGVYGHFNMLLINKKKREIEHFEPNGEVDINQKFSQDLIKFLDKYLFGYKYINPLEYCPVEGVNCKKFLLCPSDSGFCVTISQIYVFLRILNPEYRREEATNVMKTYNTFIYRKSNTFADFIHKVRL